MVKKLIEKKPEEKSVDIDKLLSKGAPVREDVAEEKEESKWTHINFRIPTDMIKKVDEALKDRVGISRNGWLLEAINDKLKNLT
jgi:hypothetical protein